MPHILVVDDDETVRNFLTEALKMQGHTVDQAPNGAEGVKSVQAKAYDLVIIDRNMPTMDGVQAIQLIRANPKFAKLKVIMCTSASVTKEVDEAFAAGATDYMVKPVNLQILLGKVKKHLSL